MKALPFVFCLFLFAGCDVDKWTSVKPEEAPTTPIPVATPKPTPKPGEWMWKERDNPLERRK